MHPYVLALQNHLTPHADPLQAGPMKAYMRGQFDYLGIKTPRRVELVKAFIWRQSDNFWLRRTAILFQLDYKKETDFSLLCGILRENLGSSEFFINKAIGWALREYSKTDPEAVRRFVASTPLNPLSRREALKWLESRSQ